MGPKGFNSQLMHMLASLEICRKQIEVTNFKFDVENRYVEVPRDKKLVDFISENKPAMAYVVGWKGSKDTTWSTILVIGNDKKFLVTRNPLPENIMAGRCILKGGLLEKTFGEVEGMLLCLETDYKS